MSLKHFQQALLQAFSDHAISEYTEQSAAVKSIPRELGYRLQSLNTSILSAGVDMNKEILCRGIRSG